MNKLYIIRFMIPYREESFLIRTWIGWSQGEVDGMTREYPDWEFSLIKDNDIHRIWEAKYNEKNDSYIHP